MICGHKISIIYTYNNKIGQFASLEESVHFLNYNKNIERMNKYENHVQICRWHNFRS